MRKIGSTFVMVQNDQTPRHEEWEEFLKLLADLHLELAKHKLFVMTPGGAPNAPQRKRLAETLGGSSMLVAVVSDAMKMRFVATMIHLIHRDHKLFRTAELD